MWQCLFLRTERCRCYEENREPLDSILKYRLKSCCLPHCVYDFNRCKLKYDLVILVVYYVDVVTFEIG